MRSSTRQARPTFTRPVSTAASCLRASPVSLLDSVSRRAFRLNQERKARKERKENHGRNYHYPLRSLRPLRSTWICLAATFALKIVVMLQLKDHVLTQPDAGLDTTAYVALADRVIAGDAGLGPALYFLSPLYIYFLAAVLAVSHSFTAVRLLQIVLGTGAVALIYIASDEWFGRRAARLAA